MTDDDSAGTTRDQEHQAREQLAELYTPEGVDIWLTTPHQWLDGQRAIDLIRNGDGDRVLAVIDRLTGGAYA